MQHTAYCFVLSSNTVNQPRNYNMKSTKRQYINENMILITKNMYKIVNMKWLKLVDQLTRLRFYKVTIKHYFVFN